MRFPAQAATLPDQGRDGRLPRGLRARASTLPVARRARSSGCAATAAGFVVRAGGTSFDGRQRRRRDRGPVGSRTCPAFAGELDPGILQLHSSDYRNPGSCSPGGVLVVGACHSGARHRLRAAPPAHRRRAQRARSTARCRSTSRDAARGGCLPVMCFLANHVLTLRTPIGRKISPEIRAHGGPLHPGEDGRPGRVGVDMTPARTVGVRDGRPVLDGRPGARRDERGVVHRVRQGLLAGSTSAVPRGGRLAGPEGGRRDRQSRAVLRRAAVPSVVLVDARSAASDGTPSRCPGTSRCGAARPDGPRRCRWQSVATRITSGWTASGWVRAGEPPDGAAAGSRPTGAAAVALEDGR